MRYQYQQAGSRVFSEEPEIFLDTVAARVYAVPMNRKLEIVIQISRGGYEASIGGVEIGVCRCVDPFPTLGAKGRRLADHWEGATTLRFAAVVFSQQSRFTCSFLPIPDASLRQRKKFADDELGRVHRDAYYAFERIVKEALMEAARS